MSVFPHALVAPAAAEPFRVNGDRLLVSDLTGAAQLVTGGRVLYGVRVALPRMTRATRDEVARWLAIGRRQEVTMTFPGQARGGAPGASVATISSVSGSVLTLTAAVPASIVRGRFISVLVGGRRYLHEVEDTAGSTVTLASPPRLSGSGYATGVIEATPPVIQGLIVEQSVPEIDASTQTFGATFTLQERI